MVDEKELLIKEVDEELRRERLLQLWKRFGPALIALAVGIVVVVAAWQGWQWYRERQLDHDATLFERTGRAVSELKPEDAAQRWAALEKDLKTGDYRLAALLRQAAALARAERYAEAATLYARAAAEADDPRLRYFARMREALARLSGGERGQARGLLERLAVPENPFYHGILELLAALALDEGDLETAGARLDAIVDDPESPPGLVQRARQLKGLIAEQPGANALAGAAEEKEAPETGDAARAGKAKARTGDDGGDGHGA